MARVPFIPSYEAFHSPRASAFGAASSLSTSVKPSTARPSALGASAFGGRARSSTPVWDTETASGTSSSGIVAAGVALTPPTSSAWGAAASGPKPDSNAKVSWDWDSMAPHIREAYRRGSFEHFLSGSQLSAWKSMRGDELFVTNLAEHVGTHGEREVRLFSQWQMRLENAGQQGGPSMTEDGILARVDQDVRRELRKVKIDKARPKVSERIRAGWEL